MSHFALHAFTSSCGMAVLSCSATPEPDPVALHERRIASYQRGGFAFIAASAFIASNARGNIELIRTLLGVLAVLMGAAVGFALGSVSAVPLCFAWELVTGTRRTSYEAVIPFLLIGWPLGTVLGTWAGYRLWRRYT